MVANFEHVGMWWNSNNIEMVKIDGEVYALYGWDGETYGECWKCTGDFYMDASKEHYEIREIYEQVGEEEGQELELIGYEVGYSF